MKHAVGILGIASLLMVIIGLVLILFGNCTFRRTRIEVPYTRQTLDERAKKDICQVLWQKDASEWPEGLPPELTEEKLRSISPDAIGKETITMLQDVKTGILPLVNRYSERYDDLSKRAGNGFSAYQLYNMADLMGEDYFKGYAGMNSIKKLEFPRDYGSHNDFQVGWYFFSCSFKDQGGNDVDLLVLFTRRAIYPPDIARAMNLSEMDNQIIDFQIALGLGDKNSFVSDFNPVISGKSGLIEMKTQPFLVRIGKNEIKSVTADSLFPMTINAYDPQNDIKIDLTLEATKPLFLQGDDGKLPDMFNLGTWYYSVPGIRTTGTINRAGDNRVVNGKTWFDNQWTAGVFPAGYPDSYCIRSLSNIMNGLKGKPAEPWAWDWLQIQLDNNIDFTLASMHSSRSEDLKNLGDDPPESVTRDVTGKMIDEQGKAEKVEGTVTIDRWVKSDISGAWHPNRWIVKIPDKGLEVTMTPNESRQMLMSASQGEFREGGVEVVGKLGGRDVGGVGFGEATGYEGQDAYYKRKFRILGIDDTPENRNLYGLVAPDAWLVVQSLTLLAITAVVLIWIVCGVVYLFYFLLKRRKSAGKPDPVMQGNG